MRNRCWILLLCCLAFLLIFCACEPLEGSFEEVLEIALKDKPDAKSVSVGLQAGDIPAVYEGNVLFPVSTTKIANGIYPVTVQNLPPGVSVSGNVEISNNSGMLTLAGSLNSIADTYSNLRLTLDGVTSPVFTLTLLAAGTPVINIDSQQGILKYGEGTQSATFQVTTMNIAAGSTISLNANGVTGLSLGTTVTTGAVTTVTINITAATPGGEHPLKLTIDGKESHNFHLIVKSVSIGAQAGKLYGSTAGSSVTFPVTTTGIKNGSYTAIMYAGELPTGVSISGNVVINDNTGTLTLLGSTNTANTSHSASGLRVTLDAVNSNAPGFTLNIVPAKSISSVVLKNGTMETINGGTVTYTVTTVSIDDGSYQATVNNLPSYVSIDNGGYVDITGNSGTLTLVGDIYVNADTYTLTLKIDIVSSQNFTLTVVPCSTGDGSPGSPFHIKTVQDLERIGMDSFWTKEKHYVLDNDIDLNNEEWTPINYFNGVFDGAGKKITNLQITSGPYYTGFFGALSGTVKNLNLSGHVAHDFNDSRVGGIAGYNGGSIENCSYSGTAEGYAHVGGIAGENSSPGKISYCYNNAAVSGHSQIGGIVGWNRSGIDNCYNTGDVEATYSRAGGIAGISEPDSECTIQYCYNIGNVTGPDLVGGVAGAISTNNDKISTIKNCVSLGLLVTSNFDSSRIVGYIYPYFTVTDYLGGNKARSDMKTGVSGSEVTVTGGLHDNKEGADVALGTALSSVFNGWDTNKWNISGTLTKSGSLPTLKNATQSPAPTLP